MSGIVQLFKIDETQNIDPRVQTGLDYLKAEMGKGDLPVGRHTPNADGLFIVIAEYDTPTGFEYFEAHRKYIDVQVCFSGAETVEYFPLYDGVMVQTDYVPADDYVLYHRPTDGTIIQNLVLHDGHVAVFYPNDVHRTGVQYQSPDKIRKAIVKVPF